MALFASESYAIEKKPISQVSVGNLITDSQVSAPCGNDYINIIWWIPYEYWKVSFAQDKTMSESDRKNFLNLLKPYSLLAICQAEISAFGGFSFYEKAEVEKKLTVNYKDDRGHQQNFIPLKNIEPDLQILLEAIKPILSGAMGNMGKNMLFFVLKDLEGSGVRKVDPYNWGTLVFRLGRRNGDYLNAVLEFPLNSLYVPRLCPNGKQAHVTWKYCPWTGKKLEHSKVEGEHKKINITIPTSDKSSTKKHSAANEVVITGRLVSNSGTPFSDKQIMAMIGMNMSLKIGEGGVLLNPTARTDKQGYFIMKVDRTIMEDKGIGFKVSLGFDPSSMTTRQATLKNKEGHIINLVTELGVDQVDLGTVVIDK